MHKNTVKTFRRGYIGQYIEKLGFLVKYRSISLRFLCFRILCCCFFIAASIPVPSVDSRLVNSLVQACTCFRHRTKINFVASLLASTCSGSYLNLRSEQTYGQLLIRIHSWYTTWTSGDFCLGCHVYLLCFLKLSLQIIRLYPECFLPSFYSVQQTFFRKSSASTAQVSFFFNCSVCAGFNASCRDCVTKARTPILRPLCDLIHVSLEPKNQTKTGVASLRSLNMYVPQCTVLHCIMSLFFFSLFLLCPCH